jgi:hypothetical protein
MFKYLLIDPDSQPHDPAGYVGATPTWHVGDVIPLGRGNQVCIVGIDDFPHAELVEEGIAAIFTVEPV